jgi:hypothetical protein
MAPFAHITHMSFHDTNIALVMDTAIFMALDTDIHVVDAAAVDTTPRRGEGGAGCRV